jgi:hypothetical protein
MCDSSSIHVLLLSPSMVSAIHEIIPGSQLEVVWIMAKIVESLVVLVVGIDGAMSGESSFQP